MSTVQEIIAAIETLSPAERAELERWLKESPAALDPEVDSPELEAELLTAIDGPYTPYSSEEMREIGERIIREHDFLHVATTGLQCGLEQNSHHPGSRGAGFEKRSGTDSFGPRPDGVRNDSSALPADQAPARTPF